MLILCTEVLSGLCRKAQLRGDLPGIKVARNCPQINHLLFADDTMFFCKANEACCETLSKILSRYEAASGQCISVQKSSITFSSKTPAIIKQKMKRLMRIPNEGGIGKYLGLPEHFGRRKRDIFSSIVDRISLKAKSWSSGFLSSAGKQVLLQAVLSATPTYAMSCFKLPRSLCKRIQSALTRFWWDDKPDKRKLCWVSWDKLTIPKNAGGLGFREIETFNDAMLAKIGWRLLQSPESLLARTLLGKYCPFSSFMECQSPSSASHGWRSIFAGRDVLKQGLGWKVGNGENIKVWRDPWLSSSSPITPVGPAPESADSLLVSELMRPNGGWDLKAIREHIPHLEGSVRRIILSSTQSPDSLVWLPEKSGVYSTKSGYALSKLNSKPSLRDGFNWQSNIWRVKAPPRAKFFLWRAAINALPVGTALAARGMMGITVCKRCGKEENAVHILLTCPFALQVWDLAPVLYKPCVLQTVTIKQLLQESRRMLNLPPSGLSTIPLYPCLFWQLWKARNRFLFEDKSFSAQEICSTAISSAREWRSAQFSTPIVQKPLLFTEAILPPSVGVICRSDAAWDVLSESCGLGWVFEDVGSSSAMCFGSFSRRFVPSVLAAEALAMEAALKAAFRSGMIKVMFYSDSQQLIKLLKNGDTTTELSGILSNIRLICRSFTFVDFGFIPRSANSVADVLAKTALKTLCNSSTYRG